MVELLKISIVEKIQNNFKQIISSINGKFNSHTVVRLTHNALLGGIFVGLIIAISSAIFSNYPLVVCGLLLAFTCTVGAYSIKNSYLANLFEKNAKNLNQNISQLKKNVQDSTTVNEGHKNNINELNKLNEQAAANIANKKEAIKDLIKIHDEKLNSIKKIEELVEFLSPVLVNLQNNIITFIEKTNPYLKDVSHENEKSEELLIKIKNNFNNYLLTNNDEDLRQVIENINFLSSIANNIPEQIQTLFENIKQKHTEVTQINEKLDLEIKELNSINAKLKIKKDKLRERQNRFERYKIKQENMRKELKERYKRKTLKLKEAEEAAKKRTFDEETTKRMADTVSS